MACPYLCFFGHLHHHSLAILSHIKILLISLFLCIWRYRKSLWKIHNIKRMREFKIFCMKNHVLIPFPLSFLKWQFPSLPSSPSFSVYIDVCIFIISILWYVKVYIHIWLYVCGCLCILSTHFLITKKLWISMTNYWRGRF